jgi:hypothetical protein
VYYQLIDELEVTEHGAVANRSFTEYFVKYHLDDGDEKYMHAYQNALGFFPRFHIADDDMDSDMEDLTAQRSKRKLNKRLSSSRPSGVGKPTSKATKRSKLALPAPPVQHGECDESDRDAGSQTEEGGDDCDDDHDGGMKAFSVQYLRSCDDEELCLIETNQYDARYLDEEGEERFQEGLDLEAQRKAALQATYKRIRKQLQQREKLAQVRTFFNVARFLFVLSFTIVTAVSGVLVT